MQVYMHDPWRLATSLSDALAATHHVTCYRAHMTTREHVIAKLCPVITTVLADGVLQRVYGVKARMNKLRQIHLNTWFVWFLGTGMPRLMYPDVSPLVTALYQI